MLDKNRLFPAEGSAREVAAKLYETVHDLPIISPHGHTDPAWFAENQPFPNPSALFIQPDHYIFRMLYSQETFLDGIARRSADGWKNNAPIRARCGGYSRGTITCFAERPRGYG